MSRPTPNPHTAKRTSIVTRELDRVTVWAVEPRGWRDALAVLLGRYDARIWIKDELALRVPADAKHSEERPDRSGR